MKLQPAPNLSYHHLVFLLFLLHYLHPMTKPEPALILILCPISLHFLICIQPTKSLPVSILILRPAAMTHKHQSAYKCCSICPISINPQENYAWCIRCRHKKLSCSQLVEAHSWSPRLSNSQVNFSNPPCDGKFLFASCASKVYNTFDIIEVTTQTAMDIRKVLMEYLLLHCHVQIDDGMTFWDLSLIQAEDVVQQLRLPASRCNTVGKYSDIFGTSQLAWGVLLEVHLIAHKYQLNITVFTVDPHNPKFLVCS